MDHESVAFAPYWIVFYFLFSSQGFVIDYEYLSETHMSQETATEEADISGIVALMHLLLL